MIHTNQVAWKMQMLNVQYQKPPLPWEPRSIRDSRFILDKMPVETEILDVMMLQSKRDMKGTRYPQAMLTIKE